jgi:hypothetical protein
MWNKKHFVSYEKDLYNSLCFNNLMINEEFFQIQKEVKCDYSFFYNKYTVDMFNGNDPIIHRKKTVGPVFLQCLHNYRGRGMFKEIMIDVINNLQPDEYNDYIV